MGPQLLPRPQARPCRRDPRSPLLTNPQAGSHTVLVLLEHGFKVCIMDNLDNSFQKAYDRMVELAGDKAPNMKFIKVGRAPSEPARPPPPSERPPPLGGMIALCAAHCLV